MVVVRGVAVDFGLTAEFYPPGKPAGAPVLVVSLCHARTFFARMRGLLGHPPLTTGRGLLIERCPSVHTVGMRYPLDLVFLDAQRRVTRTHANVAPNRLWVHGGPHAHAVIEFAAGWAPLHLLAQGTETRLVV